MALSAFIAYRKFFFAACACLAACMEISAAAPRAFDADRIHGFYRDGDFDKVIRALDGFQKSGRKCAREDSVFLEKHLAVVYAANPATRELGRYHMHKLLDLSPSAELIDMFVGEEVDGVFEKVRKEHALNAASQAAALAAASRTARIRQNATRPLPASPSQAPAPVSAPVQAQAQAKFPSIIPSTIPSTITEREREDRLAQAHADLAGAAATDTSSSISWKDTRVWVGGGTALALVAFTLYYAGSPKERSSKTYVVPAQASH